MLVILKFKRNDILKLISIIFSLLLSQKKFLDVHPMGRYETQIILIKNLIYNLTDHIFTYTLMAAVSVETSLYSVLRIVIKKSI